jgi:hypothetical protein
LHAAARILKLSRLPARRGITHGADGSTAVHTNARGVPAILAHTHVWTILIVVVGFVAMAAIFGWMLRGQLPPQQRDTDRAVGARGVT